MDWKAETNTDAMAKKSHFLSIMQTRHNNKENQGVIWSTSPSSGKRLVYQG